MPPAPREEPGLSPGPGEVATDQGRRADSPKAREIARGGRWGDLPPRNTIATTLGVRGSYTVARSWDQRMWVITPGMSPVRVSFVSRHHHGGTQARRARWTRCARSTRCAQWILCDVWPHAVEGEKRRRIPASCDTTNSASCDTTKFGPFRGLDPRSPQATMWPDCLPTRNGVVGGR